jgi:choice-of-anchor B domain-containing protein
MFSIECIKLNLRLAKILLTTALVAGCSGGGSSSGTTQPPPPTVPVIGVGPALCSNGTADGFPCRALRLHKNVGLGLLGAGTGNDIWGWTDPQDQAEYAIIGLNNGTAFVNVTDPDNPVVIGRLPTAAGSSDWRDIKVAQDHAYIVADNVGNHGMQVFDLTRLRGASVGQNFVPDTVYGDFRTAHNLAINEATHFAYAVGSNTCSGGLHMIDISTAKNPLFAGCHVADGETHDAQCVTYSGPDTDYTGREICFNSNEDHVAIVDVSVKSSTLTLATFTYSQLGYVHQGWLTEDQRFLFIGDEADEQTFSTNTRTLVFDVSDLDSPVFRYAHTATTRSIDHNLYVRGNRLYQANYSSGLRILEFSDPSIDTLNEIAWFDTRPEDDDVSFTGAWSVYPYFASGNLIVSDTRRGLFIVSF